MTNEQRKAFEKATRQNYYNPLHDALAKDEHGRYENDFIHHQWLGWQAALSTQAEMLKACEGSLACMIVIANCWPKSERTNDFNWQVEKAQDVLKQLQAQGA